MACERNKITNFLREILTDAIVNHLFKKSSYGKRKKNAINVLTIFFISHKSNVKTFLK